MVMNIRTTDTTVTFQYPFALEAFDGQQTAGTYRLVVDEEEFIGLSFLAYQCMATMLNKANVAAVGAMYQVLPTHSAELETVLQADAPA
jgi:hypothetical protein